MRDGGPDPSADDLMLAAASAYFNTGLALEGFTPHAVRAALLQAALMAISVAPVADRRLLIYSACEHLTSYTDDELDNLRELASNFEVAE